MKKSLITRFLTLACTFTAVATLNAQSINVVPNPNAPGTFTWSSNGGAVSGYSGTPIVLKNSLVLEYNPSGTSDLTLIHQQLAVYNGGGDTPT
jgi:hypothetical protein